MAKLSSDKTYVTVEKGDTLSEIARDYGNGLSTKQLASINNISNVNRIYIGQKIKLKGTATSSGSSSSSSSNSNTVTIEHFGIQSNSDNTIFVTWTWSKDNTENYEVEWYYHTGDSVWFVGNKSTTEDKQSTYSIPSNATQVRVRIKPISKKYTKNNKETSYWTASWSSYKTHKTSDNPPKAPSSAPSVTIEKYKLTAEYDNIDDLNATGIQFQIVKNDSSVFNTGKATITTAHASYSCTVDAGQEYKVRARSYKGEEYSDWSPYSSNQSTIPSAIGSIKTIKANSETSVYLEWAEVKTAKSYDIEYATKKEYFDGSDQTSTKNTKSTHFEITGLESGKEYFFRIRAVNEEGESAWSEIKSVLVGKDPAAPTTWSSTTTAIVGDPLNLYWVHNSEDGSSQTYAELELIIDNKTETKTIKNSEEEDEKDKTSVYSVDTTKYKEGTKIYWRVRTAGVTKEYGDWSIQRIVDVYAPPTLELSVTDSKGNDLETLTSFPFYIHALAGPNTQAPIGYHVSIKSNQIYEAIDSVGNVKMVNSGEEIYSKHFDINDVLLIQMSASNLDLENNISYTLTCTVSMNSGLTASASTEFTVAWADVKCLPNAEISYDPEAIVTHIRPYCEDRGLIFYKVVSSGSTYVKTSTVVNIIEGYPLENNRGNDIFTTSNEQVFYGTTSTGSSVYYCTVETKVLLDGVTLSVYRREFDGSFTELATGLKNTSNTFITDPHPALDYARYRIVAITNDTGAVSFYDVPGYPIGEHSIVIQWNEDWSSFDSTSDGELEQPAWSGSLLKLPYNVDISDKNSPDVSLVEYIGRKHPVSYYGTQLGSASSWRTDIPKSDKETLYALRRLAIWMGDVYVREPSGSGYWAHVIVSFGQTHKEVTIPVSFEITRVEGGI